MQRVDHVKKSADIPKNRVVSSRIPSREDLCRQTAERRRMEQAKEEASFHSPNSDFLILVVEDEEGDALLLKRALKRHGVDAPVRWVRDGLDALHYLQGDGEYSNRARHPFPDLIILDLKMPRMSGLELLAWIRDRPDLRAIPTVVMSSSTSTNDMEQAYALGANMYTIKPADFGSLVKLVKDAYECWASAYA